MTRVFDALRLALGAALVVTALAYFMPFLLPFVPAPAWQDPMSIRLVAAFDASGLQPVARFIHLVAGLLLLSNRMVPFALAAALPVNVCGAFMSVVIEGETNLAVIALSVVALNGLLMLAYLDSYRGVLASGALSDGEEPGPGGHYNSLYVNPLSGAPPLAYLGAGLVLAAALAFFWLVVPGLNGPTGLVTLAVPTLILAIGLVRAIGRRGGV